MVQAGRQWEIGTRKTAKRGAGGDVVEKPLPAMIAVAQSLVELADSRARRHL